MPVLENEIKELEKVSLDIRKKIIDVTGWAGGAHIGGSLSMVEILTLLYYKYLNIDPKNSDMEDRDRFILSKGHGGVGLATILAAKGYFEYDLLKDFNKFKSPFGMHLDANKVKGVDVSTGSLGHGLSIAVGLALGAKVQKKSWLTYCLLGDGECNEGSIWEAAMSASHYKITNMITIVDRNMLMIDGKTEEIMSIEPFAEKWKSFGFIVQEIDGHNFKEIADAIDNAKQEKRAPCVIIAKTIKGKGVDFMENQVKWHYGGLDTELVEKAKKSVDNSIPKGHII